MKSSSINIKDSAENSKEILLKQLELLKREDFALQASMFSVNIFINSEMAEELFYSQPTELIDSIINQQLPTAIEELETEENRPINTENNLKEKKLYVATLLLHLQYLKLIRAKQTELKKLLGKNKQNEKPPLKLGSLVINITKNVAGTLDEVPLVLSSLFRDAGEILEIAGKYLLDSMIFLIHGLNLGKSVVKFKKIVKDDNTPQRNTKLVSTLGIIASSSAGLTFAGLSIVVATGVLALSFAPFLIPAAFGFLTITTGIKLAQRCYGLYVARKKEKAAKKAYYDHLRPLDDSNQNNNAIALENFIENQKKSELFNQYQTCKEARKDMQRKVAFSAIEVALTAALTAGVVLGVAAIVGGTIASMGILPLAIGVGVAAAGLILTGFKALDKKKDHKFTNGITKFFSNLFKKDQKTKEIESAIKTKLEKEAIDLTSSQAKTMLRMNRDNVAQPNDAIPAANPAKSEIPDPSLIIKKPTQVMLRIRNGSNPTKEEEVMSNRRRSV